MVFRPYNFYGVLLAPISETAKVAVVDPTLAILVAQASVDNWCYLRIGYRGKYEVVKVIHAKEGSLHICRGRDNTDPLAFPAGAVIEYTLTASEIIDSVLPAEPTFYAYDAIQVVGYEVQYIAPKVEFVGVNYLVGENSSEIAIGRLENAYGCCNGNNNPAPIGGQYFILTSQLYPIEHTESFKSSASPVKGLFGEYIEDYLAPHATYLDGSLVTTTQYKIYPAYTPNYENGSGYIDALQPAPEFIEGTLVSVASYKAYTIPPESLKPTAQYLYGELQLLTNYLRYVSPPDSLSPTASYISGSLQ